MRVGSIPALTGKPLQANSPVEFREVYPRAYGETTQAQWLEAYPGGLSPRLRGNRPAPDTAITSNGSIPALTGKPWGCGREGRRGEVYPRAYGETLEFERTLTVEEGLSPRLRGNLNISVALCVTKGSIPALTGKPCESAKDAEFVEVYPRAYGDRLTLQRSIPALTGKPRKPVIGRSPIGVYPRAYGETVSKEGHAAPEGGLSPRLRGNQKASLRTAPRIGSIPALTGKPQ